MNPRATEILKLY